MPARMKAAGKGHHLRGTSRAGAAHLRLSSRPPVDRSRRFARNHFVWAKPSLPRGVEKTMQELIGVETGTAARPVWKQIGPNDRFSPVLTAICSEAERRVGSPACSSPMPKREKPITTLARECRDLDSARRQLSGDGVGPTPRFRQEAALALDRSGWPVSANDPTGSRNRMRTDSPVCRFCQR